MISISLKIDLLRHSQFCFSNQPTTTTTFSFLIIWNFTQLDFREKKSNSSWIFPIKDVFFLKCFFTDKKKTPRRMSRSWGQINKNKTSYIFYSISFRFIFDIIFFFFCVVFSFLFNLKSCFMWFLKSFYCWSYCYCCVLAQLGISCLPSIFDWI